MKHTLSELREFVKNIYKRICNLFSDFREFVKNFPKRVCNLASYPHYLLFIIEIVAVSLVFLPNFKKIFLVYGIVITFITPLFWGFLSFINLYLRRNLSCGIVIEQEKVNKSKGKKHKTSKVVVGIFFFILTLVLNAMFIYSIDNKFINELLLLSTLVLSIFHLMIYRYKASPFIFFPLVLLFSIIVYCIGIDKSFINWTLLLLLFGTTIGGNFFDKSLVKGRFAKDIEDENLILRKISFYIGLVFLYIGVYIADKVINSTLYYIIITNEELFKYKLMIDIIVKCCIFGIVFANYWGTQNKILYWIFSFCYRDKNKELNVRSNLAKVVLDKEIWKVEKDIQQDITDLKRISIDTYQIKEDKSDTDCVDQKSETAEKIKEDKRHIYYVDQESEIPEKIEGLPKKAGYSILGVIDCFTGIVVTITICILLVFYISDFLVKVDNGIYSIYSNPDRVDSSDIIEISDDTIIYNGKAETFDTRKQSFPMGKIKKNGSDITIKFYISGKEVKYKKIKNDIPDEK